MKKLLRSPPVWIVAAVVALLVISGVLTGDGGRKKLRLDEFEKRVDAGQVKTATVADRDGSIEGELKSGTKYRTTYVKDDAPAVMEELRKAQGIQVKVDHQKDPLWWTLLQTFLPFLLLVGAFLFVMNTMQGGGNRVMQFGKAKAKQVSKDQPKVTFADVAGADEAVEELQEIKEFLEAPGKFQAMGAKIPKGVLLFGPPGTGKTLLARAVAGEAGVPFFSISGSDFVEMFVGVGASRVRDLFEQAKQAAPAIVFVDEIDAVGRHRGAGLGGGHDEREQTLNQLLVEMDGFDTKAGVILIAATNRPDILDPALLRPGRFDRQIVVDRPDLSGRRQILGVHAKGKPLATSADLGVLAKRTPGFTGADLSNLLNEAAILAARRNLRQIGMRECEEAIDRVLAGPERKTIVMSEHDKLVTAYHEAGHAIVGHVLAHADPIHKVSIVARSRSLGLTFTLPEDRYNHYRSQLRDSMAMCLGGRTAEELALAEPTTGAENDIEKVTRIARAMVTEYGMSDALGPQQLGQREGEVFLGRELTHQTNYSQEVAAVVDHEVRRLIDEAHDRARAVLSHHRSTLDLMARELVERETLDAMDLEGILGPLEAWPVAGPVPDRPPIRTGRGAGRGIPIPVGGAEPADPPAVPDVRPPRRRPLVTPGRAVPVARTQAAPPPAAPPPVRAVPVARTQAAPPPVRAVPVARSQAAPPARRPTPPAGPTPPPP